MTNELIEKYVPKYAKHMVEDIYKDIWDGYDIMLKWGYYFTDTETTIRIEPTIADLRKVFKYIEKATPEILEGMGYSLEKQEKEALFQKESDEKKAEAVEETSEETAETVEAVEETVESKKTFNNSAKSVAKHLTHKLLKEAIDVVLDNEGEMILILFSHYEKPEYLWHKDLNGTEYANASDKDAYILEKTGRDPERVLFPVVQSELLEIADSINSNTVNKVERALYDMLIDANTKGVKLGTAEETVESPAVVTATPDAEAVDVFEGVTSYTGYFVEMIHDDDYIGSFEMDEILDLEDIAQYHASVYVAGKEIVYQIHINEVGSYIGDIKYSFDGKKATKLK